jgi:hypothetical protein
LSRQQCAAVGLEDGGGVGRAADLRITLSQLPGGQLLKRNLQLAKYVLGLRDVLVVGHAEPENARLYEQRSTRSAE